MDRVKRKSVGLGWRELKIAWVIHTGAGRALIRFKRAERAFVRLESILRVLVRLEKLRGILFKTSKFNAAFKIYP